MRRRRAPVRRTDGYIAGLIREVVADGEVERHDLYTKIGRLAKGRDGKRNSPQYGLVEGSLDALEKAGEIERRYAPSAYDRADRQFGKTYFRPRGTL